METGSQPASEKGLPNAPEMLSHAERTSEKAAEPGWWRPVKLRLTSCQASPQVVRVMGTVHPLVVPNRVWLGQLPYDCPDIMPGEGASCEDVSSHACGGLSAGGRAPHDRGALQARADAMANLWACTPCADIRRPIGQLLTATGKWRHGRMPSTAPGSHARIGHGSSRTGMCLGGVWGARPRAAGGSRCRAARVRLRSGARRR
jgi:hypothetical protein